MGRFNPYLLTHWHRDHGAALVDPDRSVPIGRKSRVSSVEATLIEEDSSGTLVYGPEVKLDSIQSCPLELPAEVEPLLGVRRLMGWLIYTDNKAYRNHHLVVTEVPAQNLYFHGKLQPSSHHKKSDIVKAFRKAIQKNDQTDPIRVIAEGLSSLSFQPFESRPGFVSAWLIEPRRIEELAITQRSRRGAIGPDETIRSCLRGSFETDKGLWSLGICKDLDRCSKLLDSDEEKIRLFERTENGDLFKNYRDSHSSGRGPVYRLMRTMAAALREDVFRAAVMTALAGLDENVYPADSQDSARPVIKQVKLLYHQFMYALVKRCALSPEILPQGGAVAIASSEPAKLLRERLEGMSEEIRLLGQDRYMAGMEKTASETNSSDETLAHLILAVPKEWPLSASLVSWLRCYQKAFSKDIQTLIDERLRA